MSPSGLCTNLWPRISQGNEMCETLSQYASELTLPRHAASQRDLLPYADLMAWLKMAEPESFEKLAKVGV